MSLPLEAKPKRLGLGRNEAGGSAEDLSSMTGISLIED